MVLTRELQKAIDKIDPDVLFPIHTEGPEKFKQLHDNVVLQDIGKNTRSRIRKFIPVY
jgi:mRNA degradation ribonuclease J1/J2